MHALEKLIEEGKAAKKNEAVFLDLDGVAVDSRAFNLVFYTAVYANAAELLEVQDVRAFSSFSTEDILRCFPLGLDDAIAELTPSEYQSLVPEITKIARITDRPIDMLRFHPYLEESLVAIYTSRMLSIVTNAPAQSVEEVFEARPYVERVIDVIQHGDDGHPPKPNSARLELALQKLELEPKKAYMVGDTPGTDGEAARLAGVKFIHVTPFPEDADPEAILVVPDLYHLAARFAPHALIRAVKAKRS